MFSCFLPGSRYHRFSEISQQIEEGKSLPLYKAPVPQDGKRGAAVRRLCRRFTPCVHSIRIWSPERRRGVSPCFAAAKQIRHSMNAQCIHYTSKSCFCQPVFLGNRLPRLAGTVGILRRETRPLHRCFGENAASDKSTFKILQNRNFRSLDRYAILLWVIPIDRRGIFLCPRQKSRLGLARRLFAICAFLKKRRPLPLFFEKPPFRKAFPCRPAFCSTLFYNTRLCRLYSAAPPARLSQTGCKKYAAGFRPRQRLLFRAGRHPGKDLFLCKILTGFVWGV